jgi:hypothetical protein
LIDLAWNSSRLEGNTYSLLDTKRLSELGEEAEGRVSLAASNTSALHSAIPTRLAQVSAQP